MAVVATASNEEASGCLAASGIALICAEGSSLDTLNGRVKDYAAENDISTAEAYKQIIEVGLETLTEEES